MIKILRAAPLNLLAYFVGLAVGVLDDYALVTLALTALLGGLVIGEVLPGLLIFFAGYFVLRLVANVSEAIVFSAKLQSGRMIANEPRSPSSNL